MAHLPSVSVTAPPTPSSAATYTVPGCWFFYGVASLKGLIVMLRDVEALMVMYVGRQGASCRPAGMRSLIPRSLLINADARTLAGTGPATGSDCGGQPWTPLFNARVVLPYVNSCAPQIDSLQFAMHL